MYDGKTDVEDFIALLQHLANIYGWEHDQKTIHLKTSLTGPAAECARPDTSARIYEDLRARFGITPDEAKRKLLGMRTGQQDNLRELADKIKKLTMLAYPGTETNLQETLALDHFKRVINADMSVFRVSRPPANLDEAVRTCCEYASES